MTRKIRHTFRLNPDNRIDVGNAGVGRGPNAETLDTMLAHHDISSVWTLTAPCKLHHPLQWTSSNDLLLLVN